jgi:hypothetical protein
MGKKMVNNKESKEQRRDEDRKVEVGGDHHVE